MFENNSENTKQKPKSLREMMSPNKKISANFDELTQKTQGELVYKAAQLKSEIEAINKLPDTIENKIEKQKLLEKLGKILALLPADDTENKYYQITKSF
jgi:hypothetical protein